MQPISNDLQTQINSSTQIVNPIVKATFADSKYAYNLNCFSTSQGWDAGLLGKSPVLWYKFNDTDILRDHSGNGFHAVDDGAAFTTGTGPVLYGDDGCYRFTSPSLGFHAVSDDMMSVQEGQSISMGVWYKPTAYAAGGAAILGKLNVLSPTAANFEWAFTETAGGGGASAINFTYSDGTTINALSAPSPATVLNQWIFLVATFSEERVSLYINGALSDYATLLNPINTTSQHLVVGAGATGYIDEAFITHRTLSSDGIYCLNQNATQSADSDEWCRFFSPYQVMNGMKEETLPQLELDGIDDLGNPCVANGEFFAMPETIDNSKVEVGWRSRSKSDGSGSFGATTPTLGCRFDARLANNIDVYSSYSKGRIKNYLLYYFDTNNVTHQVGGGTLTFPENESFVRNELGDCIMITGVLLVVLSTRHANDHARIHEVDPILEVDISSDVVSMSINSSRENFEDTLPIGHNNANSLDIVLDNHDKRYSPYGSELYKKVLHPLQSLPDLMAEASLLLRASSVDEDTYVNGDPWVNEGTLGTAYNAVQAAVSADPLFDSITGVVVPEYIGGSAPSFKIGDGTTAETVAGFMVPSHSQLNIPNTTGGLTVAFDITPIDVDNVDYKLGWKFPGTSLAASLTSTYGSNGGGWTLECVDNIGTGPGSGGVIAAAADGSSAVTSSGWTVAVGNKNKDRRQVITMRFDRDANLATIFRDTEVLATAAMTSLGDAITSAYLFIGQNNYYHNIAVIPRALTYNECLQLAADIRYSYAPETYSYLTPNVKFDVQFSWDGAADEIVQGTFYADTWQVSSDSMTCTASCRDSTKMFEEITEEQGVFYEDTSAGAAIANLIRKNGFPNRRVNYYDRYTSEITMSYPVAYWKLGTVYDSSSEVVEAQSDSQSYNGEYILDSFSGTYYGIVNGATLTPSHAGLVPGESSEYSMLFPGTANSRVTVADNAAFDLSTAWTFETIISPTSIEDGFIFGKTTAVTYPNNNNFQLSLYGGDLIASTTNGSNTSSFSAVTSSVPIVVGETYHVIAAFDGSTTTLSITVNGVTDTIGAFATCQTNNNSIGIGGIPYTSAGDYNFNGYIHSAAIWNRVLSASEIEDHYIASGLDDIYQFPFLYGIDQGMMEIMLEWATADLGVFYFDHNDVFNYEYRNTIHDEAITRHAISQYDLSDDQNIVNGSVNIELQSNKVAVEINPITTINSDRQSIWRAESNESLAVAGLRNAVDKYDTSIDVNSTQKVAWKDKGYLKIDDEIMSYDGKDGVTFLNVERGLFDTLPAIHANGKSWTFDTDCEFWTSQKKDSGELNDSATEWTESNCILLHTSTVYRTGGGALKVRSTVGGAGGTGMLIGPSSPRGKDAEEVRPSTSYTATAYTKAKTTARSTKLRFVWFDRNGKYISYSQPSSPTTNSTSAWTQVTHTATSPSNAKYVAIRIIFKNVADGEVHYIDDVSFPGARCKVRECRVYDIKFDQAPAIGVREPLLIAAEFDKTAYIDQFTHTNFEAHVVVSATKKAPIDGIVILEGTDPITDLNYYFAISGVPLVEESSGQVVENVSSQLSNEIKRFGLKTLTIANKFIQSKEYGQKIADWLIQHYATPVPILELETTGLPHFELGDRITITTFDQLGIVSEDFWVMSNSIDYDGGISQSMTLRRVS